MLAETPASADDSCPYMGLVLFADGRVPRLRPGEDRPLSRYAVNGMLTDAPIDRRSQNVHVKSRRNTGREEEAARGN